MSRACPNCKSTNLIPISADGSAICGGCGGNIASFASPPEMTAPAASPVAPLPAVSSPAAPETQPLAPAPLPPEVKMSTHSETFDELPLELLPLEAEIPADDDLGHVVQPQAGAELAAPMTEIVGSDSMMPASLGEDTPDEGGVNEGDAVTDFASEAMAPVEETAATPVGGDFETLDTVSMDVNAPSGLDHVDPIADELDDNDGLFEASMAPSAWTESQEEQSPLISPGFFARVLHFLPQVARGWRGKHAHNAVSGDDVDNHRQFYRIPSVIPVDFQMRDRDAGSLDKEIRTALTQDLSDTGVRLQIRNLPPQLSQRLLAEDHKDLLLDMDLPVQGHSLRLTGQVMWVESHQEGESTRYLVGVSFCDMDPVDSAAILKYARRAAMRRQFNRMITAGLAVLVVIGGISYAWSSSSHRQQLDRTTTELDETTQRYETIAADLKLQTKQLTDLAQQLQTIVDESKLDGADQSPPPRLL
ncbi:MAG: PilZ domain-containing protein [Myxococcota bacterium]